VLDKNGNNGISVYYSDGNACLTYTGIKYCANRDIFHVNEGNTKVEIITVNQGTISADEKLNDINKDLFPIKLTGKLMNVLVPKESLIFESKSIFETECVFRVIPAGNSGRSRPPIPIDSVHPFRGKPSTHSGRFRPPSIMTDS